jgi:hypothetical protein
MLQRLAYLSGNPRTKTSPKAVQFRLRQNMLEARKQWWAQQSLVVFALDVSASMNRVYGESGTLSSFLEGRLTNHVGKLACSLCQSSMRLGVNNFAGFYWYGNQQNADIVAMPLSNPENLQDYLLKNPVHFGSSHSSLLPALKQCLSLWQSHTDITFAYFYIVTDQWDNYEALEDCLQKQNEQVQHRLAGHLVYHFLVLKQNHAQTTMQQVMHLNAKLNAIQIRANHLQLG